jgi:hypoxanthine-guanine phosphoribosyltransferase
MDHWRVLHFTDLHIDDPDSPQEFLRRGRYKEYVDGALESLGDVAKRPELIVCTGDFIHKGKVASFSHAKKVLEHIVARAEGDAKSAVLCIGNHDVVDAFEQKGERAQARQAYHEFAKGFANLQCAKQVNAEKAVLCQSPSGVWALSIDSTMGATPREPGTLSDEEIDTIAGWVYDFPKKDLLVIATHYPAVISQDSVADYVEKDPDYHRRHEWRGGKPLRERIREIRRREKAPTLWLCGDIHQPEHICIEEGQFSVTTGRLGTATPTADSAIPRQVKLIQIERSSKRAVVYTASFHAKGHSENPHLGEWKTQSSSMRTPAEAESQSGPPLPAKAAEEVVTPETVSEARTAVELIDDGSLERRILDVIAQNDLYTIGRFNTADDQASLAWLSIGPLLNEPGILASIIDRMATQLIRQQEEASLQAKDIVLLGIDCWGAVLASQLSIITGSPNFCLAARGRGEFSTPQETVSDTVCRRIQQAKVVVLVSDVVATGSTMKWVRSEVTARVQVPLKWCALCIVADKLQQRDLAFLDAFGVACGALRMPIVAKDAIPDERILPARLSFARR